jgi:hypothetical protein
MRGGAPIHHIFKFADAHQPVDGKSNAEYLALGYRQTLSAIQKANREAVVYLDHPELPGGAVARDCDETRPFRFSSLEKPKCEGPRKNFDSFNELSLLIFDSLKREFPKAVFFRSYDTLCDVDRCHGVHNGKRMYDDGDHLSADGGVLMAKGLFELIKRDDKKSL